MILISATIYFNLNPLTRSIYYPISELENLDEPYIDLRTLETSLRLEFKPDDPEGKTSITRMSSYIWKKNNPYPSTIITQSYIGYSLDNEDEKLCEPFLDTEYYIEENGTPSTESIIEDNPFIWHIINGYRWVWEPRIRLDERFDFCAVVEYEEDWFDILVAKNKQIIFLKYWDGNLTVDDFLDELDRIL